LVTDKNKKRVLTTISERHLTSIMNNTKWGKLQDAVLNTLLFPPPYQAKYVLGQTPFPEDFEDDVWYIGDWVEGLIPFYSVEWIRVWPRYLKHRGSLIFPELIDITEDFIMVLRELTIPYKVYKDTIYIYGYIADPGSLIIGK